MNPLLLAFPPILIVLIKIMAEGQIPTIYLIYGFIITELITFMLITHTSDTVTETEY
jgi:hypothetical protein